MAEARPPADELATVRALVELEYDGVQIHAALTDLSPRFDRCGREVPRAAVAARQLRHPPLDADDVSGLPRRRSHGRRACGRGSPKRMILCRRPLAPAGPPSQRTVPMKDPFAEALAWIPADLADASARLDVLARRMQEAELDASASDVRRCREVLARVEADVLPLCDDAPPAGKPPPATST